MQRRTRIKPVANLSSVRRGVSNKNASENQQDNENSKNDIKDQLNDIQEKSSSTSNQVSHEITVEKEPVIPETSNIKSSKDDDVNKKDEFIEKLNEKHEESNNSIQEVTQKSGSDISITGKDDQDKKGQFKPPEHVQPRAEKEISSSTEFRKPKITPRLNISRATQRVQVDEKSKSNDVIVESPKESNLLSPEKRPESPINVFSPPSAPFSPIPSKRPETPREIPDSPGLIINHNLHHPPTPQSPFHQISHSRIRTESLCSIKSTTLANLQPRKKVRTEDQKILDNKRESRERLSNKKIEKSQLRMFDMIYYNPTSNPMKPRAATTSKEKSPKKIDLTMDLPPPSPVVETQEQTAMPVPQLRLNADGELVLDETSLVVENEEQKKNRLILANTNIVYHDELSGSYGYYKRQQRTKEWPQEETIKFFRCLNTVGTDFSLMLNLFPNRSRRDLKLKFKKEEKNNPHLVDKALLNHNTFDIEELQRELDEEDELRRKEAESKNSEVKELVKRKILKKQEAKAKARQIDKANIEKILSDGDLVLNAIDNNQSLDVKENLEKDGGAGPSKRKRAAKRKNIKPEPCFEFKKIVLSSKINSISVEQLESPISVPSIDQSDSNDMKLIKVKEKREKKPNPVIIEEISSNTFQEAENSMTNESILNDGSKLVQTEASQYTITEKNNIEQDNLKSLESTEADVFKLVQNEISEYRMTGTNSLESDNIKQSGSIFNDGFQLVHTDTSQFTIAAKNEIDRQPTIIDKLISDLPQEAQLDIENQDTLLSKTGKFLSDLITDSYRDTQENENDYLMEEEDTFECNLMNVKKKEPVQKQTIHEIPSIEAFQPSTHHDEPSNMQVQKLSSPRATEMSLDMSNEPQVSSQSHFVNETSNELSEESNVLKKVSTDFNKFPLEQPDSSYEPLISMETNDSTIVTVNSEMPPCSPIIESSENFAIKEQSIKSNLEEPLELEQPTTPVDDESFLNSLDLERLAIVVKQIDGKDFYDIHETDGDSQPISDKPLNLPRHIVDLIVSAMTQDD